MQFHNDYTVDFLIHQCYISQITNKLIFAN